MLRDNVAAKCAAWTNNGCESINHVLKSAVEWRPRKIPDLIQTLHRLVESQFVDADRALLGRGQFAVKPHYAKHRLTVDDWQRISTARRDIVRDLCFRLPGRSSVVTSTDGTFATRTAPNAGKKPHQRKRRVAAVTHSAPKRRRQ